MPSANATSKDPSATSDRHTAHSNVGGAEQDNQQTPPNPAAAAFSAIPPLLGEIKLYASHFLAAKIDGIKLTVRTVLIYAVLGLVGLIVLAAVVGTAVAIFLVGLAHGLGTLMWHQLWLGDLIVGLLVLGLIALGIYVPLSRMSRKARKTMEQKYEGKRIQQRVQYGRDINDRAAATRQNNGRHADGQKKPAAH